MTRSNTFVKPLGFFGNFFIKIILSNNFLIDNELDRYCINDRSEVQYNEDGSLDIYIQSEKPVEDKVSNWLPVSDGEFHLFLRIYSPQDAVLSNQWKAPVIEKVK